MKETIEIANYNFWANQRIADWLLSNDAELLDKECQSSFHTIGKTINHIWEAQIFYLSLMKEIPFQKEWDDTTLGAINGLVKHSEDFAIYVSQMTEKDGLSIRNVKTRAYSSDNNFTQIQLVQHCMNHSTFHRGQLITMGHQLGLSKAPPTDLLFNWIQNDK
ncbi:DinB family protein [Flammeovirga sp. SJP92]|uniref:DinB family protein n=1 Tax=Flammeovirga sp. SJP92 TaxID=1775430 RepID=UPI0007898878|nr:DinB family protein [Flammeovirga sp. SJP92]KXX70571.1 hypothetical protein AVL50_08180 [Flammeovirga sp. SJP92]